MLFFLYQYVFEMILNNFLVEVYVIEVGSEIGFQLQRATSQKDYLIFHIKTLWSFNLCGQMTSYLIHIIYNKSIIRSYGWDFHTSLSFIPMTL
jgi:hypothetical protein